MAIIPQSIGKYRIRAEIARGSFGRVYRGIDASRQDYPVAIKFMHAAHLASQQERNSFLQEAQLLTLLRHPYIVAVLDVGIEDEVPYLVMEYAANGSLYDRLLELAPRPLPVKDVLTMLTQVGTALQYAHQQNVIHRDLKPANILFNAQGDALLADFGIATMVTSSMKSGTIVGTPFYMAPEQFRGTISKEGDQYALGCIAYHAITGQLPFDAPDFFALGFKHLFESPILPTQLNPLIPYQVEAAIMKAMAKERIQRFPDVQSFVVALETTLPSSDSLHAPSPTPPTASVLLTAGEIPAVVQPPQADIPHRYIEEEGKAPTFDTPLRQVVQEDAPAQGEVSPGVLPHETPEVRTPYPGAMAWSGHDSDKQDNIPTFVNTASQNFVDTNEHTVLASGGSIPLGAPDPSSTPQKRRRGGPILIAAIIALVVVLIGSGALYAMVGITHRTPGQASGLSLLPATAQVRITPEQTALDKTYTIDAVTGTPLSSKQQVYARLISSTSVSQSVTDSATGHGSTSATNGRGSISMHNLQTNAYINYQASSSASYFDANGYTIYLSQSGSIPPGGTATIPAYATPAGSGGNLAAGTINGNYPCGNISNCSYVYSYAFSGGSDASSYTYVTQSNVDNSYNQAINQYEGGETATARANVQGQVASNEQMSGGINCSHQLSDNHNVGDHATSVTAYISVTCSVEVYDYNGARSLAASLLQKSITSTPDVTQVGKITTNILSALGGSNGTVVVKVEAKGTEVHTFSETQKASLAALIAGKSVQEAQTILSEQTGISKAVVTVSGGDGKTLPKSTKDITIVVVSG